MSNPPPNDGRDTFSRTARDLATSPLGIIALFIVLVYSMAALVVGAGQIGGKTEHLAPLIWFLVCFPVLVLACFVWLVVYHAEKLYPPTDKVRYIAQRTPPPLPGTRKKPGIRKAGSKGGTRAAPTPQPVPEPEPGPKKSPDAAKRTRKKVAPPDARADAGEAGQVPNDGADS